MILIIDFEVFKHDWILGYHYFKPGEKEIDFKYIHNDREALMELYYANMKSIWVAHNGVFYDDKILKAIIDDKEHDLYNISKNIVGNKGWYPASGLIIYDTLHQQLAFAAVGKSLKYLALVKGYSGYDCPVSWDIEDPLTDEELELVLDYNYIDVSLLNEIFEPYYNIGFQSKVNFCKTFNLPINDIKFSWGTLCSKVVEFKDRIDFDRDHSYFLPNDLIKLGKYDYILNKIPLDKEWHRGPVVDINGLEHKLGKGGLHGAKESYSAQDDGGRGLWMADVVSYYPNIHINFDLQSRAIEDNDFTANNLATRTTLKAAKDIAEKAYKTLLVTMFGIAKLKNSPFYDKLSAYNTAVYGQLCLIDLIDKLEDEDRTFELVQSNTDGIGFHTDDIELVKQIASEWEHRLGFELEYDYYEEWYQKDVNNYVGFTDENNVKSKGKYVNKYDIGHSNFHDHNKRWLSMGIVDELTRFNQGKKLNDYDLIDMQEILDKGSAYTSLILRKSDGTEIDIPNYVRYFVVRKDSKYHKDAGMIYKKRTSKKTGEPEYYKVSPECALPWNYDLEETEFLKQELDYEYYQNEINRWIQEFGG